VSSGTLRFDPPAIARGANWAMMALAALYFAYLLFFAGLSRIEQGRTIVMIALFICCAMFWAGFEQAGASFTLFAERYTDRHLFGWEIPAGAVQGVNAFFIIAFAPLFAALWVWLGKRNLDPSAPVKFAFGLLFLGLGFAVMVAASKYVIAGEQVLPTWLVLTYMLHTFGELCLSPVGLSSMTKLAPPRFVGQVMGVWFLATAIGNNLAGQFAGEIDASNLSTMSAQYIYLFWWGTLGGIAMLMLSPWIKRLMGGAK
jgi:POT family proton-dependent oligopeptide transporter